MAQIITFQPSPNRAFQFLATFDGVQYNVIVTWLAGGRRWYVNIYDQTLGLIVALPLIASPPDYALSMTAGYFTTTLVFRQGTQTFEVG